MLLSYYREDWLPPGPSCFLVPFNFFENFWLPLCIELVFINKSFIKVPLGKFLYISVHFPHSFLCSPVGKGHPGDPVSTLLSSPWAPQGLQESSTLLSLGSPQPAGLPYTALHSQPSLWGEPCWSCPHLTVFKTALLSQGLLGPGWLSLFIVMLCSRGNSRAQLWSSSNVTEFHFRLLTVDLIVSIRQFWPVFKRAHILTKVLFNRSGKRLRLLYQHCHKSLYDLVMMSLAPPQSLKLGSE